MLTMKPSTFYVITVTICIYCLSEITEAQENNSSQDQILPEEQEGVVNSSTSNISDKLNTDASKDELNSTLKQSKSGKDNLEDGRKIRTVRPVFSDQGLADQLHQYQTNNNQNRLQIEDSVEKVTQEVSKAIESLRGNEDTISATWANTFNEPEKNLKEIAEELKTHIPGYEKTALEQDWLSHTTMEFLVTYSEKNYQLILRKLRDNVIILNNALANAVLRKQAQKYVNVVLPKMKQLELKSFIAQMQGEVNILGLQMEERNNRFNQEQQRILNKLQTGSLSKDAITETLSEISENFRNHQQEQTRIRNKERVQELRDKVAETLESLKSQQELLIQGLKQDYEALKNALPKQKDFIQQMLKVGFDELKGGYIRCAVDHEDKRMEREQQVYRQYLTNAKQLEEQQCNRLARKARNIPVEKGYRRHQELAKEIEEARSTIRPLPELIRSVKVRTVTMVMAYILLALTIFGLLSLGILGTLMLAQVLMTTTANRQRQRDPLLTGPQKANLWGREQMIRRQVADGQFRVGPYPQCYVAKPKCQEFDGYACRS